MGKGCPTTPGPCPPPARLVQPPQGCGCCFWGGLWSPSGGKPAAVWLLPPVTLPGSRLAWPGMRSLILGCLPCPHQSLRRTRPCSRVPHRAKPEQKRGLFPAQRLLSRLPSTAPKHRGGGAQTQGSPNRLPSARTPPTPVVSGVPGALKSREERCASRLSPGEGPRGTTPRAAEMLPSGSGTPPLTAGASCRHLCVLNRFSYYSD